MKVLKEEAVFNSSASNLWEILSDVTRCDWIDTVENIEMDGDCRVCLLYTSPSPRDAHESRMPSSA